MPARLNGRTASALLVAGALVVSAGVGGATAGALITGRDIKDKSITAADIANRTIETRQLSDDAVASLKTRWNSGVGAPTEEGSVRGDWYLDSATGNAYKNTPSGWELRVNIMGATGAPGAVGPQGAKGDIGVTGAKGDSGETGETGVKGDQGLKGDQGDQGVKGDTGEQGVQGIQGETGEQGIQGETGEQGIQGQQGVKGDTGTAGSKWLQGTTAPAAGTGAVGDWFLDTTTWDAYEKTGSGWVVVVNLRGPIGPKGDKGDTGANGANGAQGVKGDAGANGTQGVKGDTGANGTQGVKGDQGIQGPKGDKGDPGIQGIQGIQGLQGPAGGGVTLKDGNQTTLGKVVSMDRNGISFVTSTGYFFTSTWNGVVNPAQVYYSEPCATAANGAAYLNDGGGSNSPGNRIMMGKFGVFSRTLNKWMVPSNVTQGFATSVSFAAGGFDNSTCAETPSPTTRGGWALRVATISELGLPTSGTNVNQFALPLTATY